MHYDIAAGDLDWIATYRLCIGFIAPRPIGWISTLSDDGRPNLAPFSFYNMVSANPPVVFFSTGVNRRGEPKDSLRNVEETGEFVVATVTPALGDKMVASAAALPHGRSEFEFAGVTPRPAKRIRPFLVGESPVNIECVLHDIVRIGEGPGSSSVIFGRIVMIHVDDSLLDERGQIDPHKLSLVGRLGGQWYSDVGKPYELSIPNA